MPPQPRQRILAWAFYDWANSAFATTVIAGFFPIFFKEYWATGWSATESTFLLGVANALASLLVFLFAPLLGAVADLGGAKKRFLALFTAIGVMTTAGLFLVARGDWEAAFTLYVLAEIGFSAGIIFYDALLVEVAEERQWDRVSALGYALGYLGGGLLFAGNVAMTLSPETFGLEGKAEAVRLSFLSVALWWALFSIPLFLLVREAPPPGRKRGWAALAGGWQRLTATLAQIRRLRQTALFLMAYWLYIDGVDTVVRMAVDYGLALGFDSGDLIAALLITQFVGFPAALLFGRLGERYGARRGIGVAIVVYLLVILWAYRIQEAWEFYLLAGVIGLVQGGIQSLSRSFYARLVPAGRSAEFFGFYNMLGKFAAVLGPLMIGAVAVWSGDSRSSLLSVMLLFLLGGALLWRVDVEKAQQETARI
jgi:MFS transporter, UMF1 family